MLSPPVKFHVPLTIGSEPGRSELHRRSSGRLGSVEPGGVERSAGELPAGALPGLDSPARVANARGADQPPPDHDQRTGDPDADRLAGRSP
jgi:hypothetical protein